MNALPRKWLIVGLVSTLALVVVVAVAVVSIAMVAGTEIGDLSPIKAGIGWNSLIQGITGPGGAGWN